MDPCHHIVLTGGGTGGHLFPGLAVAEQLAARLRGVRITFAGSGRPLEHRHVHGAGFDYLALPSRPLPRRIREAVPFVVENLAGYFAAGRFLAQASVDAVVGLGGYASVPMGRVAHRRGVPLVLLEQNAVLGRANRWLARRARLVCLSFDSTQLPRSCRCAVRVTGNPIRHAGPTAASGLPSRPQLLVLGGSAGARSLNENVPRALYKIRHLLSGWRIIHQSGEADAESTRDLYRKFALEATVAAFLTDLPAVMAATSLAVGRAGGTTLAELSAAGVPVVLLPYPRAIDDHQRRNAEVYAAAGGALLVDEQGPLGRLDDRLAAAISGVLMDGDRRVAMSAAMLRLARPAAASDVATLICSLLNRPASHPAAA